MRTTGRSSRTFGTASTPTGIVAGAGAIWIGNAVSVRRLPRECLKTGSRVGRRRRDDSPVATGRVVLSGRRLRTTAPRRDRRGRVGDQPRPDGLADRPADESRVDTVAGVRANAIAAAGREVWIAEDGRVAKIDPRTNTVSERIAVASEGLTALAVGAGAVWAADPLGGSVWRMDPGPKPLLRTIPVQVGVGWVAFGEGAVWASNEVTDEIYRIDPDTNRARVAVRLNAPRGVAVGKGLVWGAASDPPSAQRELPAPVCSGTYYGGPGTPRLVLVSDLPASERRPPVHAADGRGDPVRAEAPRVSRRPLYRRLSVRATTPLPRRVEPTSTGASRMRRRTQASWTWSASSGRTTRFARTSRSRSRIERRRDRWR